VDTDQPAPQLEKMKIPAWAVGFYVGVVMAALYGNVTGAVNLFHLSIFIVVPIVMLYELGGVAFAHIADTQQRPPYQERAVTTRILSALIASWAIALNWFGHVHQNPIIAGSFALLSFIGYCLWLIQSGIRRRYELRQRGMLPPPRLRFTVHQRLRQADVVRRTRELHQRHPDWPMHQLWDSAVEAIRVDAENEDFRRAITKRTKKNAGDMDDLAKHVVPPQAVMDEMRAQAAQTAAAVAAAFMKDLTPEKLGHTGSKSPRRRATAGELDTVDAEVVEGDSGAANPNVVPLRAWPARKAITARRKNLSETEIRGLLVAHRAAIVAKVAAGVRAGTIQVATHVHPVAEEVCGYPGSARWARDLLKEVRSGLERQVGQAN
jgi:hypothetical protein